MQNEYSIWVAWGLIDDSSWDSLERGELSNLLSTVEDPDTFNPDRAKKSFKRL